MSNGDLPGHFQTPKWVCNYMVSEIPTGCRNVLEPTPGEGNLVATLKWIGHDVCAPDEFWDVEGRFDAIAMNPPFTPMKLGYEILFRCMTLSDNIVALMPWLTLINGEKRTSRIVEYGLKKVVHLPRCAFPGSRVQACVMTMARGYRGITELGFLEAP